MTEQQAQSPIDDLYRKTFENLPQTPADSGWDTPSNRVWEQVQANIQSPSKGWSLGSLVLMSALLLTIAAGLYWMFARPVQPPLAPSSVTPTEQPASTTPATTETNMSKQPADSAPKPATGSNKVKVPSAKTNSIESPVKPENNTAQPLPGSKQTLPPNSTEAQKNKGKGN